VIGVLVLVALAALVIGVFAGYKAANSRIHGFTATFGAEIPINPLTKGIKTMAQIHAGKMIPFTLVPEPPGSVLERPAVVTVESPAELIGVSADGLTGFVGNRSSSGVTVKFTADGDGIADGGESFNIHYEASIALVGADATGFATNVFGDEVDIA